MIASFLEKAALWARETPDIAALLVVGSCARGTMREDSDIDLMILTGRQADYVRDHAFAARFGRILREENEDWGACQSVRVFYEDGPEVEFGFVKPSWLALPLDPGTEGVLRDGYRFLVDKEGFADRIPPV